MKKSINTVDLFCGAGGAETGIDLAIRELGMAHTGLAINHWQIAVDTMQRNHPRIDTKRMSIEEAVPADLVPGGEVDLLWASPSCTHHSRAKGGRPRSNQLRAQPELVLTWLDQLFVRRVIIENVPEFVEWGPLSKRGAPIRSMKGMCFRTWVESIRARNYIVDWKIVNCADYGDATTRRRFFLKAVRKGCGKICWPEPTFEEDPQPDLFGEREKWRGIKECLDFSDLGRSIFDRKKPLSKNTIRRIMVGLQKYCGVQFLVKMNHGQDVEDVNRPISTVVAGACHHLLCSPMILDHFKGGEMTRSDEPIGTQTTHDRFSMVSPILVDMSHPGCKDDEARCGSSESPVRTITTRNNLAIATPMIVDTSFPGTGKDEAHTGSADQPIRTIVTQNNLAVVTPFVMTEQEGNAPRPIDKPLRSQTTVRKDFLVTPMVIGQDSCSQARPVDKPCMTITTGGAIQLATPIARGGAIVDIRMRMLKPEELAAAHSFPKDYVLTGNKTDQIRQIGNSVPVRTAKAMVLADFQKEIK